MNYKKLVASLLVAGFAVNCSLPAFSADKKDKKISDKKVIKTKVSEYRLDYINTDWWKGFDDEYLNEYIYKAVENNHDLKIATLRVEQYKQLARLQFANELPTISGGFAPTGTKFPMARSTSGTWAFPVNVTYDLDLFLKNRDKTRSANKNWEKSKIEERAAYIAVSSAVGITYFNIIRADKLIELQTEIINDRKQIYELMKARNEAGLTSTADLVRADKAYVSAKADLNELKKAQSAMLNQLAVLTGESPNNAQKLLRKSYEESYLVKIPESVPSEIIDQRPDYLAAEKSLEKAHIDVRVAKKEFLPNISLLGIMAFGSSSLGDVFTWGNTFGVLSGQAMLNLFTGGKKIANLKLQKNAYEQVLHDYFNTNLKAMQEVNDSLANLKQDDEKYKNNLKVYQLEQKEYGYSKDKYESGLISYLDLLQRRENLHSLNKLVVSNKLDCNIDYISLYKATGTKIQ